MKVDNRTDKERIICFALNNFGTGGHGEATPRNLDLFAVDYVQRCLRRVKNSKDTSPDAKRLAQKYLNK